MQDIFIHVRKNVQVGNDQEKVRSEWNSHSKKEFPLQKPNWEKLNLHIDTCTKKHIVSQVNNYFPIGGHSVTLT